MTDVYVASNIPHRYPLKLQKPSTVNQRVRETTEAFIMDSGIGDDVSNKDVLDLSVEYNADYVVAKDYLHDHEATIEGVLDFLREFDPNIHPTPMLPLQPPYKAHFRKYAERGLLQNFEHIVLGGMVVDEITNADRIKWIKEIADVIPDEYHVHGLGIGGSMELVEAIAPVNILDSVDCATPEMAAINGSVIDGRLRQQNMMVFPGGQGRRKRTSALSEFNAWNIQDIWDRESTNRHCLTAYQ
jgi:tRNA-guanine family transglycosylase